MVAHNKVIWSEGLFIKPQHFQQQQRHMAYLLDARMKAIGQPLYGITHLELNTTGLGEGKIQIDTVSGIMPDGTVFHCPNEDQMPSPLIINDNRKTGQMIYLAIPVNTNTTRNIGYGENAKTSRYQVKSSTIYDIESMASTDDSELNLCALNVRFMLEEEDRSSFTCLPITRITEQNDNTGLSLDSDFIFCHTNAQSVPKLKNFLNELTVMFRERAKLVAERLGGTGQGSIADVSDFMLLQALNRMQPQVEHMRSLSSLHPERLYEFLISAAGELATFTNDGHLPKLSANYQHDTPHEPFMNVINVIKEEFNTVLNPRAISIPVKEKKFGTWEAPLYDANLLDTATFVVSVTADLERSQFQNAFVNQTTVANADRVEYLVSRHLSGIPLSLMPHAPRQLPPHSGYSYFQLDKNSAGWREFASPKGFAFHVSGKFPGFDLQFWAIRDHA